MAITTDPAHRTTGLVFFDPALVHSPATHVMIVGVGRFTSPKVKAVTSPPVSALAMADWFLGKGDAQGFANPERPLGSLAMAISAEDGDAATQYEGGPVPRATFDGAGDAIRAWVDRINSHKDNLAVVYVCSHGESLGARTAFLLEDYDTVQNQDTFGLSEVEQFARALKNAQPVRQVLIFDCCRSETQLDLPMEEEFGSKLISLRKSPNDHGDNRQQWVFAATGLGEVSTGRKNKTTIFTDSLLRAFGGAAADPSMGDWRVTPADLVRTIPKILPLHRREHEPQQKPGGSFADPFPFTFCNDPVKVQTYVALSDQSRWPGCKMTVTDGQGAALHYTADDPSPDCFRMVELDELVPVEIEVVDRDGVMVEKVRRRPRAPAEFVVIGTTRPVTVASEPISVGESSPHEAISSAISVDLDTAMTLNAGMVMRMTRLDDGAAGLFSEAKSLTNPVMPGRYRVAVDTSDGRNFVTTVNARAGKRTRISFERMSSPQEWMTGVVATGLVLAPFDPMAVASAEATHARILDGGQVSGLFGWPATGKPQHAGRFDLVLEPRHQERFHGYRVATPSAHDNADWQPGWAEVRMGDLREVCGLPMFSGVSENLVVDTNAAGSACSVAVESAVWTPMIGYLARRNFAAGEVAFGVSEREVKDAVNGKASDPFGAVTAALIAVGSGRFDRFSIAPNWLQNLATWFPHIPDGKIILARYLGERARTASDRPRIRHALRDAVGRGVPAFSLALEWLADGLEEFGEDEDAAALAAVRRAIVRLDPAKPFVTFRLPPSEGDS